MSFIGIICKRKIDLFKQYYLLVCANDNECILLRDKLLSLFKTSNANSLNVEFQSINDLVFGISNRLSFDAIIAIWITCCHLILKHWASSFYNYEEYVLLKYLLQCWFHYQQGINLFYSMTISVQNVVYKVMKHQIIEICSCLFIQHFISNDNKQEIIFDSIWRTIQRLKKNNYPLQIYHIKQVLRLLLYVDVESKNQIIYYRLFAFPFLKQLKCYYRKKTKEMMNAPNFSMIDYLHFVESTINEEMIIAEQHLFTQPLIRMEAKLLYSELISQYKNVICNFDRFYTWIESKNWSDFIYFYNMVKFDDNILRQLAKNFEEYIKLQLSSIELVDWKEKRYDWKVTLSFTQKCNQLFQNATQIIKDVFQKDTVIHKSMLNSFRCFINSNKAFTCIISLMIHFVSVDNDAIKAEFYRSGQNQQELFKCASNLLSFVEDKSSVVYYNRRFLCERILYGLNYSVQDDVNMISELFETINAYNTFNVKLLLNDYIKSYYKTIGSIDVLMELFILNASLWDLEQTQTCFNVPKNFSFMFNLFEKFFYQKDSKKKLKLNQNYCSALLVAHFKGKEINFLVTLRQLAILLVFNNHKRCSYELMKEKTKLDHDSLQTTLKVFVKHKLLITLNYKQNTDLTSCFFEINELFNEETIKDNLINWIKLEHCSTYYDVQKIIDTYQRVQTTDGISKMAFEANIDMNKFCVVEAAIVRTMKCLRSIDNIQTLKRKILSLAEIYHKKSLSMSEFTKIVKSLEKRGYLRFIDDGRIVYEP